MAMKDEKIWKHIILGLITFVLIMTITMIIYISVRQRGLVTDYTPEDSIYRVDDGWEVIGPDGYSAFTDFGTKLSVNELHISRIFVFPQNFRQDTLNFIASFCAVEVIQDGVTLYSFGTKEMMDEGVFPGKYEVDVKLNVYPGEASEVEVIFISNTPLTISPFFFRYG